MRRIPGSVSRFFFPRKKSSHENYKNTEKDWAFPEELCRRFSLAEITTATQCFDASLFIGSGVIGSVYKGRIKVDGDEDRTDVVAIKRIFTGSEHQVRQFRAEVELLCQLLKINVKPKTISNPQPNLKSKSISSLMM